MKRLLLADGKSSLLLVNGSGRFLLIPDVVVLSPDGDNTITGWTTQAGGTSNLYQTVDEAARDNADYVKAAFA